MAIDLSKAHVFRWLPGRPWAGSLGSPAGKPSMAPEDSPPMVRDQLLAIGVVALGRSCGVFRRGVEKNWRKNDSDLMGFIVIQWDINGIMIYSDSMGFIVKNWKILHLTSVTGLV